MASTVVTVIASVRAAIHRQGTGAGLTDATLVAWANELLPRLLARIQDDVPDYFTKVTSDIVLAEGLSTVDVTAAPVSLTDFAKPRIVEFKSGAVYLPLRWAPYLASTVTTGLGGTYRVKYLPKAYFITGTSDATDLGLPFGLEVALIEQLAARCRRRFNESQTDHLEAAKLAFDECRASLIRLYGGPLGAPNVNRMQQWPRWRFRGPATIELVGGL
jgi:hypothetical protein